MAWAASSPVVARESGRAKRFWPFVESRLLVVGLLCHRVTLLEGAPRAADDTGRGAAAAALTGAASGQRRISTGGVRPCLPATGCAAARPAAPRAPRYAPRKRGAPADRFFYVLDVPPRCARPRARFYIFHSHPGGIGGGWPRHRRPARVTARVRWRPPTPIANGGVAMVEAGRGHPPKCRSFFLLRDFLAPSARGGRWQTTRWPRGEEMVRFRMRASSTLLY